MSSIFWEIAKRNIRVHFLRSTLAMLGIVIGVVAIASMGILGNSMVSQVSDSLSKVGDIVTVYPYTGGGGGFGGGSSSENMKITDQQFQQIKRVVAPSVAIPVLSTSERMKVGVGGDDIFATVYGIDPKYNQDLDLELTSGGFNNANSGCIVGSVFAEDNNIKVGSRIAMGTDGGKGALRVTGIIKEQGMSLGGISTDNAIITTESWFDNTYNRNDYDEVVVKVKKGQNTADVKTTIEKQLNKRDKIVSVMDSKAMLDTLNSAFGSVTTFVTAIGGISMIVAGVSIFNIMMMSVNERIKEIGIMRSIGTQKKEVMSMFIYEATIIGVIGSVIGGLLSLVAGYAISALMLQSTEYLWTMATAVSVAEGVGFGIIICIACGIYPAWQAANLNPIDALRHE